MLEVKDAHSTLKFMFNATQNEMLLLIDNLSTRRIDQLLSLLEIKIRERITKEIKL